MAVGYEVVRVVRESHELGGDILLGSCEVHPYGVLGCRFAGIDGLMRSVRSVGVGWTARYAGLASDMRTVVELVSIRDMGGPVQGDRGYRA